MAFQSVPETAEAVCRVSVNDVVTTNTFYFRKSGGYDQTAINTLADAVDAWYTAQMKPKLCIEATYLDTVVRGLESLNDLTAVNNDGTGAGAVGGEVVVNHTSFAVKRLSGLTGRSARGRIYITGMPIVNQQADENRITQAAADAYVTALDALKTAAAAVGWQEVIVSRYSGGVQREEGVVFVVVNYAYTDLILDTQRGRMPTA